ILLLQSFIVGILDTGLICREYKHPHFMRDYPTLVENIHRLQTVNPGSRMRKRPMSVEKDAAGAEGGSKMMRNSDLTASEELREENYEDDIGTVPASRALPPPPPLPQFNRNFRKWRFRSLRGALI